MAQSLPEAERQITISSFSPAAWISPGFGLELAFSQPSDIGEIGLGVLGRLARLAGWGRSLDVRQGTGC